MPADPAPDPCSRLLDLVGRLRSPGGCPWDREQTFRTLTPYLLEETLEVLDGVESGDIGRLREELGDLLFITLLFCAIAQESDAFTLADVVEGISRKIRTRHPHVFERPRDLTSKDAHAQWEAIKRREARGADRGPLRAGTGRLPALLLAFRLQEKAASFGFDWKTVDPVFDKIEEELREVREAVAGGPRSERAGREIGDLLFSIVVLARHLRQDPERILRGTVDRFCRRFEEMDRALRSEGKTLEGADPATLETAWERAKTAADP